MADRDPAEVSEGLSTPFGTQAVPRASIDWGRSLPWWRLISESVSIAWRATHLFVAAVGLVVTALGWQLGARLFAPTLEQSVPFDGRLRSDGWDGFIRVWGEYVGAIAVWNEPWSWRMIAYAVFGLLWTIATWTFFGGLLARRSVMELGNRTSVGWFPTARLVFERWRSMMWAIVMPLSGILLLSLVPIFIGLVSRLGFPGERLALFLMIGATLLVLCFGWLLVIAAFGFPLSITAIVTEKNADAFDGVSRATAYTFQRTLTLALIVAVASGVGWFANFVIQTVLAGGEQVLWGLFAFGAGRATSDLSTHFQGGASGLYQASHWLVDLLRASFFFSFFWTVAAAAYLTLRWEIDHTDFDELDLQELGEPVPLPTFEEDSRGVAEVVTPGNAQEEA